MIQWITNFEINILMWIQNNLRSDILDNIMKFVTTLGDAGIIWITLGIILLINSKTRKIGLTLLLALALTSFMGEAVIKNIVCRDRPFLNIEGIKLIIEAPTSYSFPSGHTASSFAAATVLGYYFRKYAVVFYSFAALMAFSRLYLFVHYPTDILGGILLGICCSLIMIYTVKNRNIIKYKYKVKKG